MFIFNRKYNVIMIFFNSNMQKYNISLYKRYQKKKCAIWVIITVYIYIYAYIYVCVCDSCMCQCLCVCVFKYVFVIVWHEIEN